MAKMDINNKIFAFAYTMAFRDATMRNAFPRRNNTESERESNEAFHERKDEIKHHSEKTVRAYIDSIISESNQESYDSLCVIKALCDEHNTNLGFSFGNAQKLVNMTAKYMYLSTYGDEKKRELFSNCHCPMDSVMMDRIVEKQEEYSLGRIEFEIPWSRLKISDTKSLEEYKRFQEYIQQIADKKKIYPIEVDFLLWDE